MTAQTEQKSVNANRRVMVAANNSTSGTKAKLVIKKLRRPDSANRQNKAEHRKMLQAQLEALKSKQSQAMVPKTPQEEEKVPFEETTNQSLEALNRPSSSITQKLAFEEKSVNN